MTDRLKPNEAQLGASAQASDLVHGTGAASAEVLDFSPSAKPVEIVAADAAGLVSFAPAVTNISDGPIIIDEEELARDFSSAFHIAAGKRDSREFPVPDLYKDHD